MDKFAAMRVFVKIAEAGNLSAAGRQLGLSLTSVSRQLMALEEVLGTTLVERTTRHLSLTESGRLYYERAKQILEEVAETERGLTMQTGVASGRLHVSAPSLLGRLRLAPMLPGFLAQQTRVSVDLMLVDRPVRLAEEGVDVALRIGPLEDKKFQVMWVGAKYAVTENLDVIGAYYRYISRILSSAPPPGGPPPASAPNARNAPGRSTGSLPLSIGGLHQSGISIGGSCSRKRMADWPTAFSSATISLPWSDCGSASDGGADTRVGDWSKYPASIGRGVPPSQLRPGGAPHHGDAQAGTIGYFFLCKFSITVRSRGKCAWSNCGGVSAIHWSSERSA
jgi:molybdenum-dependent DNA-binding transcriptional regulator ModE